MRALLLLALLLIGSARTFAEGIEARGDHPREDERAAKRSAAEARGRQVSVDVVDDDGGLSVSRLDALQRWVEVPQTSSPRSCPADPNGAPRALFAAATHAARNRLCATRDRSPEELREKERARRSLRTRETAEDFRVEVPVVFHVIWNSAQGAGWVSEERASAQVDVLNRAFGGRTLRHDGSANPNAVDTGVSFRLHAVRYTDVSTDDDASRASFFREDCAPGDGERVIKRALAESPETHLNVYTCEPDGGTLGWISHWPDEIDEGDVDHGVFLLHSTLPGGDANPYHLGDTAVHETGHFFGLYHTFQGGCHDVWDLEAGDAVFDTPPQAHESHGSCPELAAESPDTCTLPGHSDQTVAPYFGADPYWNFMDYAYDNCMSEFTPGQASRLREVISQYKPTLCASMPGQSCEGVEGNVQAFSGSPGETPPPPPPPSPTPPSSIQCANPDFVSWSLTLQADDWPMEIGWRLTKKYELVDSFLVAVPEEEAAVAEVNFGDLMEPGGSWTWRRCLGPGVYTLRIRDSWGDGMCCFFGSGAWSTSLDGITVMNGDGDHGDGVDVELRANVPGGAVVGPEPPPPEPPPPPTFPRPPPHPQPPAQQPPSPRPPPPPRRGGLFFPIRGGFLSA